MSEVESKSAVDATNTTNTITTEDINTSTGDEVKNMSSEDLRDEMLSASFSLIQILGLAPAHRFFHHLPSFFASLPLGKLFCAKGQTAAAE